MSRAKKTAAIILLSFFFVALLAASMEYTGDVIMGGAKPVGYAPGGQGGAGSDGSAGSGDAGQVADNGGNSFDLFKLLSVGLLERATSAVNQDPGISLLVIAFAAAVVAAVSAFALARARKRLIAPKMATIAPAVLPVPGESPPESFEGSYRLQFPRIVEPFPRLWGANEPLELMISGKGDTSGSAVLSVDESDVRSVTLDGGIAHVTLALTKGRHRIRVGPSGDSTSMLQPSWADIRIVDYREEIVHMFNDMCRDFLFLEPEALDRMTPRELERSAGAYIPESRKRGLNTAVAVFEIANYSLHTIYRSDYERMYLAGTGIA